MRRLFWLLTGAIVLVVIVAAVAFISLRTRANGFSTRATPSELEEFAARTARGMALPVGARDKRNPIANSSEILREARAHWADHCALCHANDGSGDSPMGRLMYPHAPDMRKELTQRRTDGELFYIIENGIRLSGMPAWGSGTDQDVKDTWKLVHFIRHLPDLSPEEIREMERLNPKSLDELEEERQEEQFLKGQPPSEAATQHHHH